MIDVIVVVSVFLYVLKQIIDQSKIVMIITIKRQNSDDQNHDQSDAVGQAGSDSVATTKSLHVTNLLIDKGPSRSYRCFEYHWSDDDSDNRNNGDYGDGYGNGGHTVLWK